MDENCINGIDYSGYYPFITEMSEVNISETNKKKNNYKKYYLKYNYRFLLALIIFIICTASYIINQRGVIDITDSSKIRTINEKSDNEFNITKFLISNDTCKDYDLISSSNIRKYFEDIDEFRKYKKLNNYLNAFSFISSLILLFVIYYINRLFMNAEKENKILKIFSFILGSILLINEFIIFIIYLNIFLRLYEIISYIETNIDNKCIILLTWDYTINVLKQITRTILVLGLFKICNLQLIVYFLKQLIILNNFFNYDEDNEDNENNKDINIIFQNDKENFK